MRKSRRYINTVPQLDLERVNFSFHLVKIDFVITKQWETVKKVSRLSSGYTLELEPVIYELRKVI